MSKIPLSVAAIALVALSGCTTTDLRSDKVRTLDSQRITAVERVAKDAGVHIIWINPPTQVDQRTIEYEMTIQPKRDETPRQEQP